MRTKRRVGPGMVFVMVCLVGFGARQAIGSVYSAAEATQLIGALSRAGLYLGSAVVTASATTLALMLTLIGMIRKLDQDFDRETYRNVDLIGKLSTATLMMSLLVLLAFTLPVGEFEKLPPSWYTMLYEILFAGCVLMVALIAATVAMIYITLRRVITTITPGEEV